MWQKFSTPSLSLLSLYSTESRSFLKLPEISKESPYMQLQVLRLGEWWKAADQVRRRYNSLFIALCSDRVCHHLSRPITRFLWDLDEKTCSKRLNDEKCSGETEWKLVSGHVIVAEGTWRQFPEFPHFPSTQLHWWESSLLLVACKTQIAAGRACRPGNYSHPQQLPIGLISTPENYSLHWAKLSTTSWASNDSGVRPSNSWIEVTWSGLC